MQAFFYLNLEKLNQDDLPQDLRIGRMLNNKTYRENPKSWTGPNASLNSKIGNLFSLTDVSVEFGDLKALKNIELKIDRGDILFVTGASGAGKTTLLKVLAGEVEATKGKLMRPGRDIFLGKVFQELRLVGKLTCEKALWDAYDPNLYHGKKEFECDLAELCRIFGITDRLDLKLNCANGGLKQKVAIIRAFLTKPDVFIADEPTSSLDLDNARKLYDVLNLYNAKKGLTVIWATHNRDLVNKFSGRIAHLDNGRLVYSGHACFI